MKKLAFVLAVLSAVMVPASSWAHGKGMGSTAGGSQGAIFHPDSHPAPATPTQQ